MNKPFSRHSIISLCALVVFLSPTTVLHANVLTDMTELLQSLRQQVLSLLTQTNNLAQVSGASSGLVAHYTFDDGSGTTANDSSGNSNTGTLVNGPTWTSGKVGSGAIELKSSAYVSMTTIPAGSYPVALQAWVKTATNSNTMVAIGLYRSNNRDHYLELGVSNGTAFASTRNGSSQSTVMGVSVADGLWHHLVVVFESSTFRRLYVDGVEVGSSADTVNYPQFITAPSVGAHRRNFQYQNPGSYFTGIIDDVRIYRQALTASEVAEIYTYTSEGLPTSNPTNGSCGLTQNNCTFGTLSNTTQNPTQYLWSCLGENGGTTASCSLDTPTTSSSHNLSITKVGSGGGTVTSSNGSINCGSSCSISGVTSGTVSTLTASPASGSIFSGWSGGGCSGTGACTITLSSNVSVTATFTAEVSQSPVPSTQTGKCSSINTTVNPVTFSWTFDTTGGTPYCGKFANGDWWVSPASGQSGVRLQSVSLSGGGNLYLDENPRIESIGFLSKNYGNQNTSENILEQLPKVYPADISLVAVAERTVGCGTRAISGSCVGAYHVVTVLQQIPPGNGADILRPSIDENLKKLMSMSDFDFSRLPSVNYFSGTNVDGFEVIRKRWSHSTEIFSISTPLHPTSRSFSEGGRAFRASYVVSDYASGVASAWSDNQMKLFSSANTYSEKKAALAAMLVYGKDIYDAVYEDMTRVRGYGGGAGQGTGKFPPVVFFAALAKDNSYANVLKNTTLSLLETGFAPQELEQINIGHNGPIWGDSTKDALSSTGVGSDLNRYWGSMEGAHSASMARQELATLVVVGGLVRIHTDS
ncbi:MAG: LamG domain-containing protein [Candidatus Paceibacterota bacterium]